MLAAVGKHFSDVSVLRRILFAMVYLPEDLPHRLNIALDFATDGNSDSSLTAEQLRVLSENLYEIDSEAFASDKALTEAILQHPKKKPLGIVLISENQTCPQCRGKLLTRKDRPSSVVVYHDTMGSVPGSHYHKYCSNKKCGFTQYFGYHTGSNINSPHEVYFDENWEALPYFVSSRESVLDMNLLRRFNSEIILGQQSFKQLSDVYNHLHIHERGSGSPNPLLL